ncbi:endonuclease/exonuclease/phosphatase family protein [Anaerotignum lactatifermentans]|uniref:Endonuclease/exonuclease/phosphatase family protein n=1 Tax=Anaerotignum lactatifermentans TaxID=160404 RepID=A0ABS2GB05_9FIRM|nr:endonuclease/exonuclease/phosphatase family protein [Anaerotignum lactatifermentans]MBM6829440.1 endonuclease/exonuclease/phosphatase family protein [Anaerotignum lactatifermentans]MBM6877798.1 endonuclease/exonuclease/phosphatase family protein [Anaerotignum lactatifermentans]MBM6951017.1 endonuclease/exonuclease/phosphatase family protein [Anaerotignum lactatifermentans]
MKGIWKKIGLVGCGCAAAVALYGAYVWLTYHRLPDEMVQQISRGTGESAVKTGVSYRALTYNLGFGAYTPDFTFFMDGGKRSVAESAESVENCIRGAAETAAAQAADFLLFQEVDLDSTRSHHINQYDLLKEYFTAYDSTNAVNYDSAYLMVPPWEPHGKSLSSIAAFSRFPMEEAERRSLPVASGWRKLMDLDRCYSRIRIPVENGKTLCLYEVHLSAYGHDDSVRAGQVDLLAADMAAELEKGNYIICGGDFNHDMKRTEAGEENAYSWAHIFPRERLPEGIVSAMDLLSEREREEMADSTRYTDTPYDPQTSLQVTVDGFLISENVILEDLEVLDTGYQYSDHNPILLQFRLE